MAVTLNPLMVLVASQAAMKKLAVEERLLLESEPQAVLEALVADQVRSHQRPCRSVPADQVQPKDPEALRATWMPSLWVHAV